MSSFIDDIEKIEDNQLRYIINTQEDNTDSLSSYLPNGEIFRAKTVENSNVRKMLSVFASELIRKETSIKTVADQYYPFTTETFLAEWEAALLIPDDCFKVEGRTIEERQKQVIAKLAIDNIISKDDFIALAKFFGYTITIRSGFQGDIFPGTFPMVLEGDPKTQKFTMIVTFYGIPQPGGFPYEFPVLLDDNIETEFLECLIRKLSPANVLVLFEYSE